MTDLFQSFTASFGADTTVGPILKVTTSIFGSGPSEPQRTLLLNQSRHDYFIETMESSSDGPRRWRTQIDAEEVKWYLDRLRDLKVPAWPTSPTVPDGEFVELTVHGQNAQLTLGWWLVPPDGAEYLGELVDWMRRHGAHDDDQDAEVNMAEERLDALLNYLKASLLRPDRHEIYDKVINSVLNNLRNQPSPEEDEDHKSAFEFIGLLHTEGSSHILYEMTMGILRKDLFEKVCALDDDSQIALLLPMSDDTDEMARFQDIEDWPEYLRSQDGWLDKMLSSLLDRIPERYRF